MHATGCILSEPLQQTIAIGPQACSSSLLACQVTGVRAHWMPCICPTSHTSPRTAGAFSSGNMQVGGELLEAPRPLPWYPHRLAWHFAFSRAQLRKLPMLEVQALHLPCRWKYAGAVLAVGSPYLGISHSD